MNCVLSQMKDNVLSFLSSSGAALKLLVMSFFRSFGSWWVSENLRENLKSDRPLPKLGENLKSERELKVVFGLHFS